MKKRLIFNILLLFLSNATLTAQGGLLLDGGVQLVCNSTVKIVVENGKWKNSSSTFTKGLSTLKFAGTASAPNSLMEGDNTSFYGIEIAKSLNNLRLESSITTVENTLVFSSRNIDLNGKTIVLGTNGNLSGEKENSRTYSAMPLSSVSKTQNLNNPANLHIGNMGMLVTASGNFGNTTLDRRHRAQTLPTGDGIQKYWRVNSTNLPAAQNATLRFQYFDAELNGLNEADLTLWRSTNNGASWTDMGFSSRSSTSNYVEQIALSDINGWWTLGEAPPVPLTDPTVVRAKAESQQFSEPLWSIFPNPFAECITVSIASDCSEPVLFECCNPEGKVVSRIPMRLEKGENTFQINLQSLPAGRYIGRLAGKPIPGILLVKAIDH